MSIERWRRVEQLYHAALERSAADRPAFLAEACAGDASLQREVQSLLDQVSTPGFLTSPAIEVAAAMVEQPQWTGRRLGAYQITALLGQGGMGEVYRARDMRLGRDVAIKVLPKAFTSNADRLARFEREARLLAALNHPHIGTIHGVEEAEGVRALVLELVEGETIADLVQRGPLMIKQSLTIARQIADALDAAHDKGIVHRDLKPANVKITPDGVVKVLDFGLAKTDTSAAGDLALSPTITAGGTESGIILGTAAYMSPEQARGQAVDKRADVWAFGCVLYEMLTGRAAFAEATSSDTIAAILHRDPDWSALPPGLPASVITLLHRCLDKDVRRRKREIGDARAELDDALNPQPAPSASGAPLEMTGYAWRIGSVLPWMAVAAIVAGTIGAATVALWPRWENPLANAEFSQLTSFPGSEENVAISPDGRWVAFLSDQTGKFHVWVTPLGPGGFTDLTPQDEDQRLNRAGSPDLGFTGNGQQVWLGGSPYRTRRFQLLSLTAGGTRGLFLSENVSTVTWSPDGTQIIYNTREDGDPLYLADRFGGSPVKIYGSTKGWHNHGPVWSPKGEWVYFMHGQPDIEMDLWRVRPKPGSTPEALTQRANIGAIAPLDEHTVLYSGRAEDGAGPWLWALDARTSISHRVSAGLEQYTSVAASADGQTIAASRANPRASLWSVPILLDRLAEQSDVRQYGPQGVRALSPRVRGKAVYFLSALGGGDGLWRYLDGQFTEIWKGSQGALLEPPSVSRDGQHVAVILRRNGRRTLTVVETDGSGTSSPLAEAIDVMGTGDWSRDGKSIIIAGRRETTTGTGPIFKIPVDGGPPVEIAPDAGSDPVFTPDDAKIFFGGADSGGVSELFVAAGGGEPAKVNVRMNAVVGNHRMLPDGSGMVFVQGTLRAPEFWLLDLATMKTRQLTHISDDRSLGDIRCFDISADGKQIIFDRVAENSDIVLIKRPPR
jgi:serine/threonine protein kinase/Tol biopolymer transport system component